MKYYSEILNKTFDSAEECTKAEKEHNEALVQKDKEKEQRKVDAKEVQDAYASYLKEVKQSQERINKVKTNYYNLRNAFIKKYGSFHYTINGDDMKIDTSSIDNETSSFINLLDNFLNSWFK